MPTTTMATTMRKILKRTYDDQNDNDNDDDERPCFFRQQPTLVGCIPGRGVVGNFYDYDNDEDDDDGDDNEDVFEEGCTMTIGTMTMTAKNGLVF